MTELLIINMKAIEMIEGLPMLVKGAKRKPWCLFKVFLAVLVLAGVASAGSFSARYVLKKGNFVYRQLDSTCTGEEAINRNWRRTFAIDGINGWNIKEAHYGNTGAVYLSGIGASDAEYFLLRLEVETLTLTWILTHTRRWYTTLASDESYVFAAENLGNHVMLEINASTGVIVNKYSL